MSLCLLVFLQVACSDRNISTAASSANGPQAFVLDAELTRILSLDPEAALALNNDVAERDRILGLPVAFDLKGDITRFDEVNVETLELLLRGGWADPRDTQNLAPSFGDFFKFMKKWPQVKAFGYAVSSKRSDYRVSLEGLFVEEVQLTSELKAELLELAQTADEVDTNAGFYAWWD